MELYLSLTNFHHRRAICNIRISAHHLMMNLEGIKNRNPYQGKSEYVKIAILMKLKMRFTF